MRKRFLHAFATRWLTLATIAALCLALAGGGPLHAETQTGYLLIDTQSGKVLEAKNADRAFIPASTVKLIAALAALDRLGPEHRLKTSLETTGSLKDGILDGDLVLRGGGDVELDLDDIMALTLALRKRGIRTISGRFLVADNAFLRVDAINPEQPLDAGYNAGVGPLTLAFGRVDMIPAGDGTYFTNPELVERGPAWRIALGVDSKRKRAIPVRDVGMHAARTLRQMAAKMGIDLPPPTRGKPQAQPRKLLEIMSKPVADLVEDMLVYSNNQLAETLGLATAQALRAKPETLKASANLVWEDLRGRLGDVDWDGFHVANHSGLAPSTRATPRQLTALLSYGLERHALPHMLPANGWSGSLSRRLVTRDTLQRVWAKTGSLDFAASLAGYLLTHDGRLLQFAILSDDQERRVAYDRLDVPTAAIRAEAQTWARDVDAEHDNLLRTWLNRQRQPEQP